MDNDLVNNMRLSIEAIAKNNEGNQELKMLKGLLKSRSNVEQRKLAQVLLQLERQEYKKSGAFLDK